VNNQSVIGTLMNICDDPERVSIGQDWIEQDMIRRTPIVVTGNDFTKMFAPLIRDGRMASGAWACLGCSWSGVKVVTCVTLHEMQLMADQPCLRKRRHSL